MSKLMMVTNAGESVVGASTITRTMATELASDYGDSGVQVAIGGNFFRKVTLEVFKELGSIGDRPVRDLTCVEDCSLEKVVSHVLKRADLYGENDHDDLSAAHISTNVSRVGKLRIMQEAFSEWTSASITKALEEESKVLIVDARNPRDRAMEFIESGAAVSALDLMICCLPPIAAERSFRRGNPGVEPTEADLLAAETEIVARRKIDRERADYPFRMPERMVTFIPSYTHKGTVEKAYYQAERAGSGIPDTVLFDTSYMKLTDMKSDAVALAKAALEMVD